MGKDGRGGAGTTLGRTGAPVERGRWIGVFPEGRVVAVLAVMGGRPETDCGNVWAMRGCWLAAPVRAAVRGTTVLFAGAGKVDGRGARTTRAPVERGGWIGVFPEGRAVADVLGRARFGVAGRAAELGSVDRDELGVVGRE